MASTDTFAPSVVAVVRPALELLHVRPPLRPQPPDKAQRRYPGLEQLGSRSGPQSSRLVDPAAAPLRPTPRR